MKPAELTGSSFTQYPPIARQFALEHLELLRRLPLAVCPSFLQQIRDLDTRFPAEREELRWQCDSLQRLPAEKFTALTTFLSRITLPESLQRANWVQHPADFINDLTAHLWSSGQLDSFRAGSHAFFAAIPLRENTADRLVVVLLGREATTPTRSVLRKLSQRGVVLSALSQETAFRDLHALVAQHAAASPEPYANWYVDGGEPSVSLSQGIPNIITVSYPGLAPLRQRAGGGGSTADDGSPGQAPDER